MVDFSPKDRSNHQINTQLSTHPTPTAGGEAQRPTRRNFVVWYLGGLLAAMTAALLAPLLVYLWPTGSQVKATDVKVTIPQPLDELAEGGSLQFNAPANYGFKMIDGGGDNYPGKVSFGAYAIKTAG
ncbi:MAG: hypothetical protein ACREP9_07990, partial [Candidatus Dormibacteraceae bacterium]